MQAEVDQERLNSFLGRMLGDLGATFSAALVVIGDGLGLYKALAEAGPLTAAARRRTARRCSLCRRMARGSGGLRLRRV